MKEAAGNIDLVIVLKEKLQVSAGDELKEDGVRGVSRRHAYSNVNRGCRDYIVPEASPKKGIERR